MTLPKPVWDIPRRSTSYRHTTEPEVGSWVYVIRARRRPWLLRLARRFAIVVIGFCALTLLVGWQR